jgi:hypothetical protein
MGGLFHDWAWKIREQVAQNPFAPEEVVRALAGDGDQSVERAVKLVMER